MIIFKNHINSIDMVGMKRKMKPFAHIEQNSE
ncbi:hypothetical protein VIF_003605 [Vibrio cholerae TM 11079-80]|nr:hypothetical protein VIF_003605 [Vibrio cholerae TM 11079-80]